MEGMYTSMKMREEHQEKIAVMFYHNQKTKKRFLTPEELSYENLRKIGHEFLNSGDYEMYLDSNFEEKADEVYFENNWDYFGKQKMKIYLKNENFDNKVLKQKNEEINGKKQEEENWKNVGETRKAFLESFELLMKQDLVRKFINKEKGKKFIPKVNTNLRPAELDFIQKEGRSELPADLVHIKEEICKKIVSNLKDFSNDVNRKRLRSTN